jgi:hypothetical protein
MTHATPTPAWHNARIPPGKITMHPEHKTVTLIRHAKDEQAEKGMSDMDRPLKQKGEKQAAHLAKELKAFLQQPPAP